MAVVYIHKRPDNNDIFYVGIGNDVKRAYNTINRNDYWKRKYNKYGLKVDIISENLSLDAAREMEKFLIASIGVENLCNMTLGGEGAFGLKHTEKTKTKLKELLTSYSVGRVHDKETREKISRTRKEKGIQISEITRQRQKEAWRQASMKVKELTTNTICYMWEAVEIFNASYRTVNGNSVHDRPIARGKTKGLNFIRI
jgi:hypothetical protein